MNGQVETDTREDLELWLEDTVVCEFRFNDNKGWHPHEAEWRAFGQCPNCQIKRTVMLCSPCKEYMQTPGMMYCSGCGVRKNKTEFFTKFITL